MTATLLSTFYVFSDPIEHGGDHIVETLKLLNTKLPSIKIDT